VAAGVKVPRHRAGPPETITESDYQTLLRVPDRRSQIGKRDHALLRLLGDCGLRSAELRGVIARDLRRPRVNARHVRLYVRGKGGSDREVPIPDETQAALEAWLAVHPLARGRGLRDEHPVFVRLGRYPGAEPPERLSAQAVHKLVRRSMLAAGVPERLAHPHALRTYWATSLLEDGVAIHRVSNRLGHADLRTTSRYAAEHPDHIDDVADVLDRRHQAARRERR
jgi:site-specific recombinase XerC